MSLHITLFRTSVRRIHQYNIKLIFLCVIKHIFKQGIIMVHTRHINAMKKHIRNTEHVWELLLFDTVNRTAHSVRILCGLDLSLQLLDPAYEESTSATSKIP